MKPSSPSIPLTTTTTTTTERVDWSQGIPCSVDKKLIFQQQTSPSIIPTKDEKTSSSSKNKTVR